MNANTRTREARARARANNASLSGNLNFLNKGRNIAFHVGDQSNGTPIYRSEDSHVLARWFLRSNTHPFTRNTVPMHTKWEVFRRALETSSRADEPFTRDEIARMQTILKEDPASIPPAKRLSILIKLLRHRLNLENYRHDRSLFGSTDSRRRAVAFIERFGDPNPVVSMQNNPYMDRKRTWSGSGYVKDREIHADITTAIVRHIPGLLTVSYPKKLSYPSSPHVPNAYTRSLSRGPSAVDPLYVSLKHGRIREALKIRTALGPQIQFNSHRALREAIFQNDGSLFEESLLVYFLRHTPTLPRREVPQGEVFSNSEISWRESGATLLHVAIIYGRLYGAILLLHHGLEDPRFPFVYDPGFRMRQSIQERRVVVPTLDLIHQIKDDPKNYKPKLLRLVKEALQKPRVTRRFSTPRRARTPRDGLRGRLDHARTAFTHANHVDIVRGLPRPT